MKKEYITTSELFASYAPVTRTQLQEYMIEHIDVLLICWWVVFFSTALCVGVYLYKEYQSQQK
jgi:hypothetical protein